MPDEPQCTCDYPDTILRNGSGHQPDCPVHMTYLAMLKGVRINQANRGVQIGDNNTQTNIW